MKLTVFGASGATGTCLVEQAAAAGHEVTAVVRDPARLAAAVPPRSRLQVVTADVMDPAAIAAIISGQDAVLSAVGPRGTGPGTVASDSARSIIQAMHKAGASRLMIVSGSIVADAGEGPVMRHLIKPLARATMLRHVCADMRRAEDEVRASGLDWTIMRPPRLTGKPPAGGYRTAIDRNLRRGVTISRADLAACMLALLDDRAAMRRHVAIAN